MSFKTIILAFLIATPALAQQAPVVSDAELQEHWQTCMQPQHYEPIQKLGRSESPKLLPEWERLCAPIRDERAKRRSAQVEQAKKKSLEDAVQKLTPK